MVMLRHISINVVGEPGLYGENSVLRSIMETVTVHFTNCLEKVSNSLLRIRAVGRGNWELRIYDSIQFTQRHLMSNEIL